jgi:RNA polymerase subunit RPABC4/transcription elongation factor Spt4
MTTPEPGPQDCRDCGATVDATANFCPQCGTAIETFCPDCGEAFDRDDEFCSHCGHQRGEGGDQPGDSESHPTETAETEAAFRRRVTDHLEAGWELKDDHGDHVTLVDRDIGSIPLHVLLLFATSGVGNLLYGWYHYAKRAERRYLSIGDGRQPRPPGIETADGSTTATAGSVDASLSTAASYLLGGLLALIGLFVIIAAAGGGTVWPGLIGLGFALGGLGILPPVRRKLDRRHEITKFGRLKHVDHRVVHPTEGYDEPCIICGKQGRSGLLRRRRDETLVAGIPLVTHGMDDNYYCEQCATADRVVGEPEFDATTNDGGAELSTAEME